MLDTELLRFVRLTEVYGVTTCGGGVAGETDGESDADGAGVAASLADDVNVFGVFDSDSATDEKNITQ